MQGLPGSAYSVSAHARGLRPRQVRLRLAVTASTMSPAACAERVGTREKRRFRGSILCLHLPLSTLRRRRYRRLRMTRGQCGWLDLHCQGLAPFTTVPAYPGAPRRMASSRLAASTVHSGRAGMETCISPSGFGVRMLVYLMSLDPSSAHVESETEFIMLMQVCTGSPASPLHCGQHGWMRQREPLCLSYPTCASVASACGSQKVISMAQYKSIAIDSSASACARRPVCVYSVPRPR
jgi:hypothetical protein